MSERIEKESIFDRYPYDDGALEQVYNEAQVCVYNDDGTILEVKGVGQRSWFFLIPVELRESVKHAPRPERLIILYELLHRGLVMFRDNEYYHIGTLNSEIIKRLDTKGQSDDRCTNGCHFFDLAYGYSLEDMRALPPGDRFFNHFNSNWELEIFFDYDI